MDVLIFLNCQIGSSEVFCKWDCRSWVRSGLNFMTLCAKDRLPKSPSGRLIQGKFSVKRKIQSIMHGIPHPVDARHGKNVSLKRPKLIESYL